MFYFKQPKLWKRLKAVEIGWKRFKRVVTVENGQWWYKKNIKAIDNSWKRSKKEKKKKTFKKMQMVQKGQKG